MGKPAHPPPPGRMNKTAIAAAAVLGFGFRIWLPLLGLAVIPFAAEAVRLLRDPKPE